MSLNLLLMASRRFAAAIPDPEPPVDPPGGGGHWTGATHVAASNSVADVTAALAAASDGDIIVIPNGSVTWSSGISTTKKVLFRAATIAPVNGGRSTQSLIIANNSAAPLFEMSTDNTTHVGVAGIRFNEGTQATAYLKFTGSGSKVPIYYDCYFQNDARFGTSSDVSVVVLMCQGGLSWANKGEGVGVDGAMLGSAGLLIKQPRAWNTASTLGALDTAGAVNFYEEDCNYKQMGVWPDLDDGGRAVFRNNYLDGIFGSSHGPSSLTGGRHVEYYGNEFAVTVSSRNHGGRYYYLRAGTGVFWDNLVNNASAPGEYGNCKLLDIGEDDEAYGTGGGTGYPAMRGGDTFTIQCGWGHDGSASVLDPIYIYDQRAGSSSASAYVYGIRDGWGAVVVGGREIYPSASGGANPGAKPGYSPYTYPHPLRSGCPLV